MNTKPEPTPPAAPTRAQEHAALALWFAKRGDHVRAQVHEALAREYAG